MHYKYDFANLTIIIRLANLSCAISIGAINNEWQKSS